MKILIIPMLVLMSSTAVAEPLMTELWRDKSSSHSFSDERYQKQYSPAQRQYLMDQRNAEIAHRHNAEMAKLNAHANEMQQYYASEYASREFIDDTRRYNAPPMMPMVASPVVPQMGQYYPQSNSYYGNGGNQLRYTPAQTQGFIDQYNVDRARQAQVAQEQADANYERWRQQQNSRRDTERFVGFSNNTSSVCEIKSAMSNEDRKRCQ